MKHVSKSKILRRPKQI